MSDIYNNPLLYDEVIERDYGLNNNSPTPESNTKNLDIEEPVDLQPDKSEESLENKESENNSSAQQTNTDFDPSDLDNMGIDIPSMSFEDESEEDDITEDDIPPTKGYEVKASIESVKPLASVITGIVSEYAPKIGGMFAKQNMTEIHTAVKLHGLPQTFVSFFEQQNKIIEDSLQISKNNLKEFNKALIAYLRTKKIEEVGPGYALLIQGVAITTELTFISITANAKKNKMKEEIYAKFNIQTA